MIAASLGPVGHAAAAQHTYTVTQGGQCWEATPLGDGSKSVSDFYDYRSGNGTEFSSYGTTQLQRDQVSQLFLYRGTSGTSLVFLHDELQSSENETRTAGAITMQFSGLPADGSWVVEDDTYPNRDDNFNHSGSTSKIDWMWAPGRTDGAAFRGSRTEVTTPSLSSHSSARTHGRLDIETRAGRTPRTTSPGRSERGTVTSRR
ncbi:hypothetical protein VB773_14995 [Haloarculaceae archaeon H-GB2-1]|nr:hypothetical protein [Haloarculaceae archaeon H-GB2-1]